MNSVDSKFSFEVIDQPSDAAPGSMVIEKCDYRYATRMSGEVTFPPAATSKEIEKVHEEDSWVVVSAEETDMQKIGSISSNHCPDNKSEFHEYQSKRNENMDTVTQNLEPGLAISLDQSSYSLIGSMHIEEETEPVLKETLYNPEAFQHHEIHRHRLHDASNTVINQPAQSPLNIGGTKSPFETPCTPVKWKETENNGPLYPQIRNNAVNIPKPSGIGLHLNSIVNVLRPGSSAVVHVKSAQNCKFNIRGKKSIHTSNSDISDMSKCSSVFTLLENVSECTEDTEPEIPALAAVKSDTSLSNVIIKSSNNPLGDQSDQDHNSVLTNMENDGILEELKSNSKRKRKRSWDSSDGCKRCHCKKSKCLKLYCDCFAAGLYCAGSCACQECYNRPEYEDKVLESRQQIESRNPLAFAPKIVEHVEPLTRSYGEDETQSTPSLARHKRGCNCKKSMCLKKYCECYHANVGCSDDCGCKGCKNVHGQKGEYNLDKDFLSKEGTTDRSHGSFIDMMQSRDGGLCDPDLTPRTPAVRFFKKDVPEQCVRPKQSIQSLESSATLLTPNFMTPVSPRNSDNGAMISETAAEVVDLISSQQELYCGNAETLDEYQPGRKVNLPGVPDSEERGNHSKTQSFTGTNRHSPAGSHIWLGSPGTPLTQPGARRSLKAVDLDVELSNTMHDDTPDILKDSLAPLNAVKSSSPNMKRISPPHTSQQEFHLRSLNGLKTGRKFILKAVPSAPSLTPGVDPKSALLRDKDGPPRDCSRKK